ncbi:MAG: DUF397 domain-containing protein [Actinomycetes bacterium]
MGGVHGRSESRRVSGDDVRQAGGRLLTDREATLNWTRSSFSSPQGGNCVEVAGLPDGRAVRDSKDPAGPALRFTAAQWWVFTAGVCAGEFD